MKDLTAIFNAKEKTLKLSFEGEIFVIDLTQGDLHDSWNGITLKNGDVYDFNFSWERGEEPSVEIYSTYYKDKELYTDHSKSLSFKITKTIGNSIDYFDN